MRKIVLLIFLITFFFKIDHLLAQKKIFEQGKPQYGNMGDDPEFNADAPWRVNGSDVSIPIMVLIKDADAEGDDVTLQKIEIKYNDFIIYSYDPEPDELINQGLWVKYFNEKSANDIGIPINSTAEFIVELYLHDDGFDYTYEKHLQVYIASDDLPTFNNWYSGDTHFHSFYTDNSYEYGGPINAVSLMSNALGLDWITITDHSCDFDAEGNQFNDLQQEINNVQNSECVIIRGEEVTIDNDNENDYLSPDEKIHLLVYNNDFIRGPENGSAETEDTDQYLTKLTEALDQVKNGGFAYAAHPTDDYDPWYLYVVAGALEKWSEQNYQEAFNYKKIFNGLEIWNERTTFKKDVSSSNINPFPWNDGEDNTSKYKENLDDGISIWENKLISNLNPLRKVFLAGGSDAHGDFNYRTYKENENFKATNSAFAKVRTVAYANSKAEVEILDAFRKGHTFVTDGPAAIFSIDFDGDGNFETILGDSVFLPPKYYDQEKTRIKVEWKNTDEFGGNIRYMYLYLNDQITSLIGYFGIEISEEGIAEFSLKEFIETYNLNYQEDEYFYLRLEVFTENQDYRCYSNPIWIYIDPHYLLADFESDIQEGYSPLTVQFEDLSVPQDEIESWTWDFGDGNTSTLQNPSHTYSEPGTYTVSLTVTNNAGETDIEIKENYITATNEPTLSNGTVSPSTGTTDDIYTFTVTYTDPGNHPPDQPIEVVIDGYAHDMTAQGSDWVNGVEYKYQSASGDFSEGEHSYYYKGTRGETQLRDPESGNYTFTVDDPNPEGISLTLDPNPTDINTPVTCTATTNPVLVNYPIDFEQDEDLGTFDPGNPVYTDENGVATTTFYPSQTGNTTIYALDHNDHSVFDSKSLTINEAEYTFQFSHKRLGKQGNEVVYDIITRVYNSDGSHADHFNYTYTTDFGHWSNDQQTITAYSETYEVDQNLYCTEDGTANITIQVGNSKGYYTVEIQYDIPSLEAYRTISASGAITLSFSPVDDKIAYNTDDNYINIYDVSDNQVVKRFEFIEPQNGYPDNATKIRYSPDGTKIFVGSEHGCRIIEAESGTSLAASGVVEFSSDWYGADACWVGNDYIMVGADNHETNEKYNAILYASNLSEYREYLDNTYRIYSVDAAGGKAIASDGDNHYVTILFNSNTWQQLNTFDPGGKGSDNANAISPDGSKTAFMDDAEWLVYVFDNNTYDQLHQFSDASNNAFAMDWNPTKDEYLAVLYNDNKVLVWNLNTDGADYETNGVNYQGDICWSGDGEMFATASENEVKLFTPFDTENPTVTITAPVDGYTTTSETVQLEGYIGDDTEVSRGEYRVNSGEWISLELNEDDQFSTPVSIEIGDNMIEVKGYDVYGKSSISSVNVTRYTKGTAPTLSWTGEEGYTDDGVDPDEGVQDTTFNFRVKYVDTDNEQPANGYPKVHISKNNIEIAGSPFSMEKADDNPYYKGRIFTYSNNSLEWGNDYTYRFEAKDESDSIATGEATQEKNGPIVTTHHPTLTWTGENGYESDGVDPDEASEGLPFEFRIKYTDTDNDAPKTGYPKVHILKGGTEINNSPFTMNELNTSAFNSGRIYGYTADSLTQGDDYTYYFEATDVTETSATGEGTSEQTGPNVLEPGPVTVTSPNGGETWHIGSEETITWNDTLSENVRIDLFNDGNLITTIAQSTESDGKETWVVPDTITVDDKYKIKVVSVNDPEAYDLSDQNFSIAEKLSSGTTLTWTGEPGFESDGVNPDKAGEGSTFEFRVTYLDTEGDEPGTGYPVVHIFNNDSEISGSPFAMSAVNSDPVMEGRIYTYSTSSLTASDNYTYRFEAQDTNGDAATGEGTHTMNGPVVQDTSSTHLIEISMTKVEGGTFVMGDDGSSYEDEKPEHEVTVSTFQLGKYEITNQQVVDVYNWALGQDKISVTSATVKNTEGDEQELLDLDAPGCYISYDGNQLVVEDNRENHPVCEITWYGAAAFANYYSEQSGLTPPYNLSDWSCNWDADGYRLPTEAEWEFAAGGGNQSHDYTYSGSNNPDEVAWYIDNSDSSTHDVGTKAANELGFYDMSGNALEWCWDWQATYPSGSVTDPKGPDSGSRKILRGGDWCESADILRVTNREYISPYLSNNNTGFRIARNYIGNPTLTWTGETGYESDGVNPDEGEEGSTFEFRVKYTDAEGEEPSSGYPVVHIFNDDMEISGSPFEMSAINSNPVSSGRIYTYSISKLTASDNYSYKFEAFDSVGHSAIGDAIYTKSGPIVSEKPHELIAFWSFDDGTATDNTGNGNDGTPKNGVKIEKYAEFDGIDDEIEINATQQLKDVTSFDHSISLWLYLSEIPATNKFVIDMAGGGDQHGIRFENSAAPTYKWMTSDGAFRVKAKSSLAANNWYHIVTVVKGDTGKIYINSNLDSTVIATGTLLSSDTPIKLGNISGGGSGDGQFYGGLDEVRVYNYALTQYEIDSLYNVVSVINYRENPIIPSKFVVFQNYPNPFNPITSIKYGLHKAGNVRITIYNITGKKIVDLVNNFENAGFHTIKFKPNNLASGIYFYLIEFDGYKSIRKMILLK